VLVGGEFRISDTYSSTNYISQQLKEPKRQAPSPNGMNSESMLPTGRTPWPSKKAHHRNRARSKRKTSISIRLLLQMLIRPITPPSGADSSQTTSGLALELCLHRPKFTFHLYLNQILQPVVPRSAKGFLNTYPSTTLSANNLVRQRYYLRT
jgi:hypothetical protein